MTARQREALDFIREHIEDQGVPPTCREIGSRMGIRSTNGVYDHLKALERKGYLERDPLKSRVMRIVEDTDFEQIVRAVAHGLAECTPHGLEAVEVNIPGGRYTPRELAQILPMLTARARLDEGVVTVWPEGAS